MSKKETKSKPTQKHGAIVCDDVGNYEKHPFFVKKANRARDFLKKTGLPAELVTKSRG